MVLRFPWPSVIVMKRLRREIISLTLLLDSFLMVADTRMVCRHDGQGSKKMRRDEDRANMRSAASTATGHTARTGILTSPAWKAALSYVEVRCTMPRGMQQQSITVPDLSAFAGAILDQSKKGFTTISWRDLRSFENTPEVCSTALTVKTDSNLVSHLRPALRQAGSLESTLRLCLVTPGTDGGIWILNG